MVTNLAWHPLASGSNAQLVFARRAGQRYLAELRLAGEKAEEVPNVAPESELVEFEVRGNWGVVAEIELLDWISNLG